VWGGQGRQVRGGGMAVFLTPSASLESKQINSKYVGYRGIKMCPGPGQDIDKKKIKQSQYHCQ